MCVSCESPRNGKSQQAVPSPIAYLRDDLAVEREVSTAVGACVDALTVQVLLEDPPHCCKPVLYTTTELGERWNSIRKWLFGQISIGSAWLLGSSVYHASRCAAVP